MVGRGLLSPGASFRTGETKAWLGKEVILMHT